MKIGDVAEPAMRLLNNEDYRVVLDWMESNLRDLDKNNRSLRGEELVRGSASAQTLAGLIDALRNARDTHLSRVKSRQKAEQRRAGSVI